MSDYRLEEYLDSVLREEERQEIEEALARDPALRAELERARRFGEVLDGLRVTGEVSRIVQDVRAAAVQRKRGRVLIWAGALTAAAVLVLAFGSLLKPATHEDEMSAGLVADARVFGDRLGRMAAARREGRVPRLGLSDLEVPSSRLWGIVFEEALSRVGVTLDAGVADEAKSLVADHAQRTRTLSRDIDGECKRAAAALVVYRKLRGLAGRDVADAWYDIFRPGLADLGTARRVRELTVLDDSVRDRYAAEYERAIALLARRYGQAKLALVLDRLAPADRRTFWRDAAQEGVGRDAVLAMRARLYQAACEAGADRLYVAVG